MAERLVPLGEIVTTHGLDGWLKLNPFNVNTTALIPGREVFLDTRGAPSAYNLEAVKIHKKQFLIKVRDVNGIDAAKRYVGSTLLMDEAELDVLGPGEYYHYQVVGFEVFHVSGELIGKISSIMSIPGRELYVVQGTVKEHLIPAVKDMIVKVDFSAGKLIINPPEGLLDL